MQPFAFSCMLKGAFHLMCVSDAGCIVHATRLALVSLHLADFLHSCFNKGREAASFRLVHATCDQSGAKAV